MKSLISTKIFNATVATTAAIVLSVFLWSYSETGSPPSLLNNNTKSLNPVFYLINTKSTRYNEQGIVDMTIKSDSVHHEPLNNNSLLKQPRIVLYQDGVLEWTARSDTGVAYKTQDRIDLQQHVVIKSGDNQTVLNTPFLALYPNEKRAETDQQVTLQSPTGFTHSIGLKANLLTKEIYLLNQVRGQYNAIP